MVEDALVTEDIDAAGRLITFFDEQGLPVRSALWLYDGDARRWRFVVAFREERKDITTFYLDMARAVHRSERKDLLDLAQVDVVDPNLSVVSALREMINIEGNSRVRFSQNRINGVYLEDALIYRLSA